MSVYQAKRLAQLAQNQAIVAVNVAQSGGVRTNEDRYNESLALSVANLSQAFVEFMKEQ